MRREPTGNRSGTSSTTFLCPDGNQGENYASGLKWAEYQGISGKDAEVFARGYDLGAQELDREARERRDMYLGVAVTVGLFFSLLLLLAFRVIR